MRRLLIPLVLAAVLIVGAVLLASRTQGPRADLVWTAGPEVTTLDPAKITALQDGRVAAALFEGLTVLDAATLTIRPGVARSWTVSADKLHYEFQLRGDARWSDGRPVTAEDFIYSWRRALGPKLASQYVYMLYPIRGAKAYLEKAQAALKADPDFTEPSDEDWSKVSVRADGPHRLVVDLEQPTAYFLDLTAFSTYLPVSRNSIEEHSEDWTHPPHLVSNGPYRLAEWKFQNHMIWEKNPYYWDAANVALERIELRSFEDFNTVFLAYETGAVDMTTTVPSLALEPLLDARDAGRRDDVIFGDNLGTYFYRFNCKRAPFTDARVRRALALAIDRRAIIERAARGRQHPATVLVPPVLPGYVSPPGLAQNMDEARRLLVEAGHPYGAGLDEIAILVNKGLGHGPIAEMIQQQWASGLGLRVRIEQVEWSVFMDRVEKLDYQVARAGWYGDYMDPNTFLDMFVTGGGNNETGWSNKTYDDLIARAARDPDATERLKLLARAEAILLDEAPIIPLYFYTNMMLARPGLEGLNANPLNRIDFARLRWAGGKRP
jgi:oligopeptide transport system substrate-binding protein